MRYDDRLLTVLSQPAEDRHDVAVRWRQLVDLVARAGSSQTSPVVEQALTVIRADAPQVDEHLRAAAARSVAAWPLPFGLLQYFASEAPVVSAPVIAAAKLEREEWDRLYDEAGSETRSFITSLHPDVAIPSDQASPASAPATASPPKSEVPYNPPSLHEMVERIERRRQLRVEEMADADAEPPHAAIEAPSAFRWECDPGGEIAWVDGAPRGPLIGRSLARPVQGDGSHIDPALVRAFGLRAPFREATVTIGGAGAVAGDWKVSGMPAFDPADGRFAGYRGVALREAKTAPAPDLGPLPEVLSDPAALRELVHEIKTPLNAIIGFAEIIEGQYLGPADRGYRDRAFEIVQQARLLLTAIDDLDFAAKAHAAAGGDRGQVDLGELLMRESDELRRRAALRDVNLALAGPRQKAIGMVRPELAERLLFRLFDLLVAQANTGERLDITVNGGSNGPQLSISRPARLRKIPPITETPAERIDEGFPLRLLRGLARLAGGDLISRPDAFALIFPAA